MRNIQRELIGDNPNDFLVFEILEDEKKGDKDDDLSSYI